MWDMPWGMTLWDVPFTFLSRLNCSPSVSLKEVLQMAMGALPAGFLSVGCSQVSSLVLVENQTSLHRY